MIIFWTSPSTTLDMIDLKFLQRNKYIPRMFCEAIKIKILISIEKMVKCFPVKDTVINKIKKNQCNQTSINY